MPYYKVVRVCDEERRSVVSINPLSRQCLLYSKWKTTRPHPEEGGLFCFDDLVKANRYASYFASGYGDKLELWEVEVGETSKVNDFDSYIIVDSVKLLNLVKSFN